MKRLSCLPSLFAILLLIASWSPKAAPSAPPRAVQAAPVGPSSGQSSQSRLITPRATGQQKVAGGYLISSDTHFTVGMTLLTVNANLLLMKLSIANLTDSPVAFNVRNVTMSDASGNKQLPVFSKADMLQVRFSSDSSDRTVAGFRNSLLGNYWSDGFLAPASQGEHLVLAVCGTCVMPVTVHVTIAGSTYDFIFGGSAGQAGPRSQGATNVPAPPSPSSALRQPPGAVNSFAPLLGKWVGFSCGIGANPDFAYRIELSGTEQSPVFRLREIGNADGTVRVSQSVSGVHKSMGGMEAFMFLIVNDQENGLWILRKMEGEKKVGGLRTDTDAHPMSSLLMQPDEGQDLQEYLKDNATVCRKVN